MPPRRSRTHYNEGRWHPLVLLALVWQFIGGLVLLGLLSWATALIIAFQCFKTCKPFGVVYLIGPALMLINILVLIATHNETLHAMDETLSINRLLYCEIAKAIPVSALLAYTLLDTDDLLWLYLLILLPIPLLFSLAVAVAAKYKELVKKYQVVNNDEERPLLNGEVESTLPNNAVQETPPRVTLASETSLPRE